jgi:hypothetical protein
MVFVYDNLVECIAAVFGAGMALHFACWRSPGTA